MVFFCYRNILQSDCTVIAHQTNCLNNMNEGFAKRLKAEYPEAYTADRLCTLPPRRKLGKFSLALSGDRKRMIFNLYGQFRSGSGRQFTEYDALEEAIDRMFQGLEFAEKKGFEVKLGMPYGIGAGQAGGEWATIYGLLHRLSENYNRDIYLYRP